MDALLQVSGLTKCYPDFSLSDVSFEIPPGYVMGLMVDQHAIGRAFDHLGEAR